MLLIVPYLFPSARLLEAAAQNLRLPALQTLLARGTRQSCPAEGVEAALCEALDITRQQDWPLAPITLEADGGMAGHAYWLRADPVHLQVMRDHIVLTDGATLDVSAEEAAALAAAIREHFGADLSPQPLHPQHWYLKLPETPRLTTTPLPVAVGRDIEPLQPHGDDAIRFRTLLNELQMLLHDHPVNRAREARGDLPVNSLWLWGGGVLPATRSLSVSIYTGNAEAQALGTFCSTEVHPLPTQLDVTLLETGGIMLLDVLTRSGQVGDAYGWREALRELEQDWFLPLQGALRRIGSPGLRLLDPISGKALHLQSHDAWRLWRRPRSLLSMLS
ncbi:MAG: hypothetical protein ACYCY9_12520 [Thiobacillus sp.]